MVAINKVTGEEEVHSGDVTSIALHNGFIFSAGSDSKIKVWDLDLNFKREIPVHDAYIYAITTDSEGRLYTSSLDGTIKLINNPVDSDDFSVILEHQNEIEALFVDNDRFFCGDDRGGVTCFENGKLKYTINVVEGVKSLYVENELLYTLFNNDLSIHEMREGGKYIMKMSIPGKFPVTLFGEKTDGRSQYIAILTRDGKGVKIVKNALKEKFQVLTTKENLHEMIATSMKGVDDILFSCDYSGDIVRTQVVENELKELGRINIDSMVGNCLAVLDNKTVYVGGSDGKVRKITFD